MEENKNTQVPEKKESNLKLIIIASAALVALVAVFVILGFTFNWFGTKKDGSKETTTPPPVSIVSSKGDEVKTKNIKVSLRDVPFGASIKKVKKYEKGQPDTQNNPIGAKSNDGYAYLTYTYTPKAEFFTIKPGTIQDGSLLQYVFKDKKLFDIRMQFGSLSDKEKAAIKKELIKKYGKPTYSIKLSTGATNDQWKVGKKNVAKYILSFNTDPNSGTTVDYISVKR